MLSSDDIPLLPLLLYSVTGGKFTDCTARSKRDGTHAETRFGLSAKRTSPFKPAGVSVQSTTGSRELRVSGQRLYRPCSDVQCKAAGYSLHSLFPLQFPSLASPCAIRFRTRSTWIRPLRHSFHSIEIVDKRNLKAP